MDLAKLYSTQISMTEWLEKINHSDITKHREEDYKKRERLKVIHRVTGMPFDEPRQFEAADITANTQEFQDYLRDHGHEVVALRLNPKDSSLQKHRLRGKTVREMVDWFHTLDIDPSKYGADFVPHANVQLFSTIFVVNKHGIFGEIIKGGHYQLTQGFYDTNKPVTFAYNWKTWKLSDDKPEYRKELVNITNWLHITDPAKRDILKKELQSTFTNDYLEGYFETVTNGEGIGLWFIDYNRLMGDMFSDIHTPKTTATKDALVRGQTASKGTASGPVKIVLEKDLASADITPGDILVCDITTPDYVPLMQKAAAVVTERGGILSHAAIVCRELGKPCVAGTGNATNVLKDGQKVTVNADAGAVTAL